MWILLLLVQVKHKRTLYSFLLSKLEICNGNNEDRNLKHNRITTEMAEYTQIIPEIKGNTEVSGSYNQLLRQMYKILTDLLPITGPSLWTIHTQNYYCQYTQNTLILDSKKKSISKIIPEINKIPRSQGVIPNYSGKFTKY